MDEPLFRSRHFHQFGVAGAADRQARALRETLEKEWAEL
jgi:hypothetical protein